MEGDNGYHMVAAALVLQLLALLLCTSVRNGDVPAEPVVDVAHHLSEESAVCRSVFQLVVADVVVYHLVDDNVLQLVFGQVDAGIDAEAKVVELRPAEEVPTLLVGTLPEECLRITQLHRYRGELAVEYQPVKLLELLLYVWNTCLHPFIDNAITKIQLFR